MSLAALRAAIVSQISSDVSAFANVEAHGGKFNAMELKRIATKSPACKVAILGVNPLDREGGSQAVGQVQIGAFILTKGDSEIKRDAAALALAEAVVGLVINNAWKYEHAKAPERVRIDNLYSGKIDRLAVALWSVVWSQRSDLAIYDADALDDLHRVVVDTDLSPLDGVIEDQQTIWLQGTLMSAYGQIYVSSSAATSISVADTFQKAAGTTTLLRGDGMDMPVTGRLRHTDDVTRAVSVQAIASVSVDSDAEVSIAIAKNGVVVDESAISEDIASADGAEAMASNAILELGENDYVEAWVTADDTVNVTLEKLTLVAVAT